MISCGHERQPLLRQAPSKNASRLSGSPGQAAGHLDRWSSEVLLHGLASSGERKSVEPMAAALSDNVRQTHQSLHHVVAHAPWSDEDLWRGAPVLFAGDAKQGPIVAWVSMTRNVKKESIRWSHAPVLWAVGKQETAGGREFVVSTAETSLPMPASLLTRSVDTGQAAEKVHGYRRNPIQTKPEMLCNKFAPPGTERSRSSLLTDAAYGNDTAFREGLTELGLLYVVGIQSSSACEARSRTLPKRKWKGIGRPTKLLRRDGHTIRLRTRVGDELTGLRLEDGANAEGTVSPPVSVCALATSCPSRLLEQRTPPEEWLLIEWRKRSRTDPLLVIDSALHTGLPIWCACQAALDHRA